MVIGFDWLKKMRFKTLDEFYKAVDALCQRLHAEHHDNDARKLQSLMHETAWTTGSELLGELLKAFKDMNGKYSVEVAREIKECRKFIRHHRQILGLK